MYPIWMKRRRALPTGRCGGPCWTEGGFMGHMHRSCPSPIDYWGISRVLCCPRLASRSRGRCCLHSWKSRNRQACCSCFLCMSRTCQSDHTWLYTDRLFSTYCSIAHPMNFVQPLHTTLWRCPTRLWCKQCRCHSRCQRRVRTKWQ